MNCKCRKFDQVPLVTRKQAEEDALIKGVEGLVIGMAAGLVIGTTIALLTAPKSGKDTRRGIRDTRDGVAEKAGCAAEKVKSGAYCISDKVKTKFAELKNDCCDDEVIICECCDDEDADAIVDEILENAENTKEDNTEA